MGFIWSGILIAFFMLQIDSMGNFSFVVSENYSRDFQNL